MKKKLILLLRVVAAGILIQTLFFKFTGSEESKFIFASLGVEPWGRWFAGVSEFVASLLLLIPATQFLGAVAGLGIMAGAIASHVFVLGVVVQNDGGLLFGLAVTVAFCCASVLFVQREQIPILLERVQKLNVRKTK